MVADGCESSLCSGKVLLKASDANVEDIIRLLLSSDVKERRFIDCPEEHRHMAFTQRFHIFVSIVVQKLLQCAKKPLAQAGDVLEMWQNLVASNGGLFVLLVNSMKGTVTRPDRLSSTFISAIGSVDPRIKLDESIKPGQVNYSALLSLMAAKLSYENEACIKSVVEEHWNMELTSSYSCLNDSQEGSATMAFMLQDMRSDPNLIVVAFRGTPPFDADAWCTDIDLSWYEVNGVGRIHHGFLSALGLQKHNGLPKELDHGSRQLYAYYALREKLRATLKEKKARIVVTGHSLGGALAILFVATLIMHEEAEILDSLEGVYTFGQPRVGDEQFAKFMEERLEEYNVRYFRYVYCNDIVPRLPYDNEVWSYKHFGSCVYYNSLYQCEVRDEAPNKNYFNPLWAIPKLLTGGWEVVRGIAMPYSMGEQFRETWSLLALRTLCFVFPGIAEHCPQDYDNSIRLGNPPPNL